MPITHVILTRHAEKGTSPPDDPPLTAAGEARARRLGLLLADLGHPLGAAFSSTLVRTIRTAELAIEAGHFSGSPTHEDDPQVISRTILDRARADEVILVVHHTNTLPTIVRNLVPGSTPPAIAESNFDSLWSVALGDTTGAKFGTYPPP